MPNISRDSPDWFKLKRRTVADLVRSLDTLEQAQGGIGRILRDWDTLDNEITSALHYSSVIHYARVFSDRHDYGGKKLKGTSGFEIELHKHLLQIRHHLMAHHDSDALRALVGYQDCTVTLSETPYRVKIAAYALVKAMHGIHNRAVAERYFSHISACVECFRKLATDELAALYEAAVQTPELADFGNEVYAHSRIPIDKASMTMRVPSLEEARNANIPDPIFPILPADAYVYRVTRMMRAKEGKIEIKTPEGTASLEILHTPPAGKA